MLTKSKLRSKILIRLKTQKEENRLKKSRLIKQKLFRTRVFKKAKTVMFFITFNGEVRTQDMIKEALKLGKIIAVPACKTGRVLEACRFSEKAKFVKGCYGVAEPAIKKIINVEHLDLVIVPGVAFDKSGNRLGRGKGCYDTFLKRLHKKTTSIGLAYDFQILPSIPATTTDVKVGRVISA